MAETSESKENGGTGLNVGQGQPPKIETRHRGDGVLEIMTTEPIIAKTIYPIDRTETLIRDNSRGIWGKFNLRLRQRNSNGHESTIFLNRYIPAGCTSIRGNIWDWDYKIVEFQWDWETVEAGIQSSKKSVASPGHFFYSIEIAWRGVCELDPPKHTEMVFIDAPEIPIR